MNAISANKIQLHAISYEISHIQTHSILIFLHARSFIHLFSSQTGFIFLLKHCFFSLSHLCAHSFTNIRVESKVLNIVSEMCTANTHMRMYYSTR